MLASMANGTTALNAFQKALDVQSNNVSNTQTTAFKSDSVSFSDMIYDNNQVGYGVSMDTATKSFTQGSVTPTGSEYDFAIDGDGFFTVQDPANPTREYYTRAGHFNNDKNNFLADGNGMQVMGIRPTVTGDIITSEFENNISAMIIETEDSTYSLNTYTTDYEVKANIIKDIINNLTTIEDYNNGIATQEQIDIIDGNPSLLENYTEYSSQVNDLVNVTSGSGYKSTETIINDIENLIYNYNTALKSFSTNPVEGEVATKAESSFIFSTTGVANEEYTIEVLVNGVKIQQNFDESIENTLNLFSDKISQLTGISSSVDTVTGEVTVSSLSSGETLSIRQAKLNDNTVAITELSEATGSGQNLVDALYADLLTSLDKVGGEAATNISTINNPQSGDSFTFEPILLDLNELGMNSTLYEKLLSGDPEAIAAYPGISSEDGNIYLNDGDAQFLVGKIVPVTFTDKSQLNPEGDNLYTKGNQNMTPIFIEGNAKVYGTYIEESNVDLSKELVNILTFQKAYEANSKSITTSDELLKTALALKTT